MAESSEILLVRHDQNHMATTFELQIACDRAGTARAERVLIECHELIARLEDELTEFREQSPVAELNAAPVGSKKRLSPFGSELLSLSLQLEELTGRAFSVAAKSTGAQDRTFRQRFGASPDFSEVWRLDPEAHLGFGAIGKGFALDRCRLLLAQAGFENYLLSGGGSSIVVSGHPETGESWRIGWSWSNDTQGRPLGIELSHTTGTAIAIGVSGTHEKGLHLIDPRDSSSAKGLRSAFVCHPSAAWADALSTALFILGWEESLERFQRLLQSPGLAVVEITGLPRWNGVFQGYFGAVS